MSNQTNVRVKNINLCKICKKAGETLYRDLQDVLFKVDGKWTLMECSHCQLAWLQNQPISADLHKLYSYYHTHNLPNLNFSQGLGRIKWMLRKCILAYAHGYFGTPMEKRVGKLLSSIPRLKQNALTAVLWIKGPQGKLLDVGCGNGVFLKKMEQLGWQGHGVEFDPNSVKRAKNIGLDVLARSLEHAKYPSDTFDLVTMIHVIEHLPQPDFTLQECFRVLKPGGRIMVVTPNTRSLGHQRFKQAWRGLETPRHLYLFSGQSLATMIEASGFKLTIEKTIARTAKSMYLASLDIQNKQQGKANLDINAQKPVARRFQKKQVEEAKYSDCGEELYILAEKPRQSN